MIVGLIDGLRASNDRLFVPEQRDVGEAAIPGGEGVGLRGHETALLTRESRGKHRTRLYSQGQLLSLSCADGLASDRVIVHEGAVGVLVLTGAGDEGVLYAAPQEVAVGVRGLCRREEKKIMR